MQLNKELPTLKIHEVLYDAAAAVVAAHNSSLRANDMLLSPEARAVLEAALEFAVEGTANLYGPSRAYRASLAKKPEPDHGIPAEASKLRWDGVEPRSAFDQRVEDSMRVMRDTTGVKPALVPLGSLKPGDWLEFSPRDMKWILLCEKSDDGYFKVANLNGATMVCLGSEMVRPVAGKEEPK